MSEKTVTVYVTKYALTDGMAEAKLKSLRAQQSRVSKLLLDGFKVKDGKP